MKAKHLCLVVLALSLSLLLGGCEKDSAPPSPGGAPARSSASNGLSGAFSRACISNQPTEKHEKFNSMGLSMRFEADRVFIVEEHFEDFDCKAKGYRLESEGSFKIGKETSPASGVFEIDYAVKLKTVVLFTQDMVEMCNLASVCDTKDWSLGTPKSGPNIEACDGGGIFAESPYSVVKLEGSRLYLGTNINDPKDDERSGETPEKRMIRLDDNAWLERSR